MSSCLERKTIAAMSTSTLFAAFAYSHPKKRKKSHAAELNLDLVIETADKEADHVLYEPSSSPILMSDRDDRDHQVPELGVSDYYHLDLNMLDKELDLFCDFGDDDDNYQLSDNQHGFIAGAKSPFYSLHTLDNLGNLDQVQKEDDRSPPPALAEADVVPFIKPSSSRFTAKKALQEENGPIVPLLVSYISRFHSSVVSCSILKAQTSSVQSNYSYQQYQCDFFNPPIDCCSLFAFLELHVDDAQDAIKLRDFKVSFLQVHEQVNVNVNHKFQPTSTSIGLHEILSCLPRARPKSACSTS